MHACGKRLGPLLASTFSLPFPEEFFVIELACVVEFRLNRASYFAKNAHFWVLNQESSLQLGFWIILFSFFRFSR